MPLTDDVRAKVVEYLDGDYEVEDVTAIPSVEDVTFGRKAKRMKLCVFYIDLRKSTDLLFLHQKQTAGKIHKAFLHVVSSVVLHFGGEIRSFKGDSLMAFWPANYKSEFSTCVQAAMTVKWLLDIELSPLFESYEKIDFGIGVDWGDVFIARAGIPRNANNNDLIFMGQCVNFAVAIGEQACGPNHVEVSTITYDNLEDNAKYGVQNGVQVDMWKDGVVNWKGQPHTTKLTSWYWKC
jgi:adenylate cyclase